MKRALYHVDLLWIIIGSLVIWNIGLTFRTLPLQIITLDMARVVRIAVHRLAEVSEGDDLEVAKDKLAKRLRSVVQTYALKHKACVLDASMVIAGEGIDITEDVIKEVTQ